MRIKPTALAFLAAFAAYPAVGVNLGDLNGDGRADVLLRKTDGRWHYYPMDGRFPLVDGIGRATLTPNTSWRFAGLGDLDGDGKDDVLLRHDNGRWWYYPMDGRRNVRAETGRAEVVRDPAWRFAGIGDLNGDGRDDVLLRHEDGRWRYYAMNGRRQLAEATGGVDLPADVSWRLAGLGDLNGDGRDDVLLRHRDGDWWYHAMDGRSRLPEQSGVADLTTDQRWRLVGLADLNGDGRDDALLRRRNGIWRYYPMDGRAHLEGDGTVNLPKDLGWRVAGLGDINGDGRSDVLLRHRDGRWRMWAMNGRRILSAASGRGALTRNLDWRLPKPRPIVGVPLDADNTDPVGLAYQQGAFRVLDFVDRMVYAYAADGERDPAFDFPLAIDNDRPQEMTFAEGKLHVVDRRKRKVFAYTATGVRDVDADFELDVDNGFPTGIAYANGKFHVVDWMSDRVFAYSADGERDATLDFDLSRRNQEPAGMCYAEETFHVVNWSDRKVYAYTTQGERHAERDFDLRYNSSPEGMACTTGAAYIVDWVDDNIYPYAD